MLPRHRCADGHLAQGSRQLKARPPAPTVCSCEGLAPRILNQDWLSVRNDVPIVWFFLCKHDVSNLSSGHELLAIHTGTEHIHCHQRILCKPVTSTHDFFPFPSRLEKETQHSNCFSPSPFPATNRTHSTSITMSNAWSEQTEAPRTHPALEPCTADSGC